jgi:uncharacterized protein
MMLPGAALAAQMPAVSPGKAATPSFDCAKASGQIPALICKDPELGELDVKLAAVFASALKKVEALPNTAPEIRHMKAYELRWSRERNECKDTADARACTVSSYRQRIATLEARFLLAKTKPPMVFACKGNTHHEMIATFVESDPPSVRLERGDKTAIAVDTGNPPGARYMGPSGLSFSLKGDMATVIWPKTTAVECVLRR